MRASTTDQSVGITAGDCSNSRCMRPKPGDAGRCLNCQALLVDVLVRHRYRVRQTVGKGGFGITYLVDDQDTVQSRKVVLGPSIEGLRVVRDGVQSNDWVLVNGLMSVRPGAKVKPNRETAGASNEHTPATAQK